MAGTRRHARSVLLLTTIAMARCAEGRMTWVNGDMVSLPQGPESDIKCDSEPTMACIPLWPGNAPNETGLKPIPPESRQGNDGSGCGPGRDTMCDHVFDVSHPTLTPFVVANGTGAAIIISPGGGYHDLAFSKEGIDVAHMYNSIGVSAFVLKYRVPARPALEGMPKWWAPLQDAQRAVGIVRANAKKYGVNASQIGFTGGSAGGHLTAHISTAWRKRIYARVDASDDVPCRPDFSIFQYPWALLAGKGVPAWGAAYNLSAEVSDIEKDHPPSAFIQNGDDGTAPPQGTLAYAQKIMAVKGPTPTIHIYNKGGHGFGLCQGLSAWEEVCDWPKAAQRFLQAHGFALGWPTGPVTTAHMLHQNCAAK